ncbi:hypothetical protein [Sulfurimonas sp.]|uniref:hypothetical protein n=1 Tax=Sulfurimonas sp. TaxID=2022749 RepID=UPI003D151C76
MKTIFLFFTTLFLVSQVYAKEYTKAEEEAMLQNLLKMCEETESAKKVNKKLDEIVNVLEKDKNNTKAIRE